MNLCWVQTSLEERLLQAQIPFGVAVDPHKPRRCLRRFKRKFSGWRMGVYQWADEQQNRMDWRINSARWVKFLQELFGNTKAKQNNLTYDWVRRTRNTLLCCHMFSASIIITNEKHIFRNRQEVKRKRRWSTVTEEAGRCSTCWIVGLPM